MSNVSHVSTTHRPDWMLHASIKPRFTRTSARFDLAMRLHASERVRAHMTGDTLSLDIYFVRTRTVKVHTRPHTRTYQHSHTLAIIRIHTHTAYIRLCIDGAHWTQTHTIRGVFASRAHA